MRKKAKQKDYFHLEETEQQELLCVLLAHFTSSIGAKRFRKPDTQYFLDVSYDDDGNIHKIQPSHDFPLAELEEIESKIQETLLTDHGTKVSQMICFCGAPVTGYFRYKDLFQILPLPGDTATSFLPITEHPFILEVAYHTSLDQFVDSTRKIEKVVTYARLLNLLVEQPISTHRWYQQSAWVYNATAAAKGSEWAQMGYLYPDLKDTMDTFSAVEGLRPIERVPFLNYYYVGYLANQSSEFLTLPDSLELSLEAAFALNEPIWKKFYMACSWYAQYQHIVNESRSSAFIALVTAIESLAQEKEKCETCQQLLIENDEDICPSCGQPRYRLTKHFQDFLKKYFPLLDQFPTEKKILYKVRSGLAHGMNLLQADLEPWKLLFDEKREAQNRLQRNLYFIVGIAIFHWLHEVLIAE